MIESEVLTVTGSIACEESINGEKVEIKAKLSSSFEEIGASEFKIYRCDSRYSILASVLNRLTSFLRGRNKVRGQLTRTNHLLKIQVFRKLVEMIL
ncbi:MAG: hypothetical protein UIL36_03255 [Turicibacter sp.]|nr:hypothetical protein [Turicibacter sp.]